MQTSSRYPTPAPGYTRGHTKSFSYAQGPTSVPPVPPPSVPPQPKNMAPTPTRAEQEASALAMLTEILREEKFLQTEEVRLADRPPERLAKLRDAHKEWIVWRVRKELDKFQQMDSMSAKLDEDRKHAAENERIRREAEEARRAEEARSRERERVLKEERERNARETSRSRTPTSGPSFPWQRRYNAGTKSSSTPAPNSSGGYGSDRDSGRQYEAPPRSHTTAPFPTGPANREWQREASAGRSGWDAYQSRWNALNASASTTQSTDIRGLRFGDIPWPIFSNGPFMPADITPQTVGAFLLSPFHSVDKSTKERLRSALIQWHPDKFESRWLGMVVDSEKALVAEGVGAVARAINDLLAANR